MLAATTMHDHIPSARYPLDRPAVGGDRFYYLLTFVTLPTHDLSRLLAFIILFRTSIRMTRCVTGQLQGFAVGSGRWG